MDCNRWPICYEERNLERVAARHHFTFHCDGYYIVEHDGRGSRREATEIEIELWNAVVGNLDSGNLPATAKEIQDSFEYGKGPFLINPSDVDVLRSLKSFEPLTFANRIIGDFVREPCNYAQPDSLFFYQTKTPIYVNSIIRVGFYCDSPIIPDIFAPDGQVKMTPEMELKFASGIKPFLCSSY